MQKKKKKNGNSSNHDHEKFAREERVALNNCVEVNECNN